MQDKQIKETLKNWRGIVKKYQEPNHKKAVFQLLNSFLPFLGLMVLMYFSLNWSYLITLGLSLVAAFFLVRIFIIQHDCGHQSFLKSRRWNNIIGFISSFFSTIPYKYWSRSHSAHHAHNGQLEHRGIGDIDFLTKEEYQAKPLRGKLWYRWRRSAIGQFVVTPIVYFTVYLRFPFERLSGWKKIRTSFFANNILVLVAYILLAWGLGWQNVLMVTAPILFIFGVISFWFFYIQHQHEENYKAPKDQWDHLLASIRGSTFYKLPRLFHWLTGNIGYHHIHHLNSKIPNYNLHLCATENPQLNTFAQTLTFCESLKCIRFKLWDEQRERMISLREYWRERKG